MFEIIKKNIENDFIFMNRTNVIYLLINLLFLHYTKKHIFFLITILKIIKILNESKFDIDINKKIYDDKFEVTQISNKTQNISFQLYNNKIELLIFVGMIILNYGYSVPTNVSKVFMRNLTYDKSYSVIKYPKNFYKNIPDKFVLLLNHTHINYDDYAHIFLLLLLFPNHKYVITTNNACNNNININNKTIEKFLNILGTKVFGQYVIKDDSIYNDIQNIIKKNDKIIIIIFPEGNIKRTTNIKKYDINVPNIDNFQIIEEKCFNYKKGAFKISLMNNIPILPTVLYSPMPNNKYKFLDKEYEIKHINHIGINIFNFIDYKKSNNDIDLSIEKYRLRMEKIFHDRYIDTLINGHKNNIIYETNNDKGNKNKILEILLQ
jgi:1-acyl-sn-glycerol-3-phosphate acyltransferase